MHYEHQLFYPARLGLVLCAAALLPACGSDGNGNSNTGPSGDLGPGGFNLVQFGTDEGGTLTNGATWKINRPIELTFNQAVDFSSVSFNSISVQTLNGQPALGEFRVKNDEFGEPIPEVIVFQPRCPVESDLSDAGLEPGSVTYQLAVVGADVNAGIAVRSVGGTVLSQSQQRVFQTPAGTDPASIFFDVVPNGSATPLVQNGAGTAAVSSRVVFSEEDPESGELVENEFDFLIGLDGMPVEVPGVPINLYSGDGQDVSVLLEFDQPVNPSADNVNTDRVQLQFLEDEGLSTETWSQLPTEVVLEANCTSTGALVRIRPIGILPQGARFRVQISNAFEDLIGTPGALVLNNFASFRTNSTDNPGFTDSGALGDEVFLPFNVPAGQVGSFEQVEPDFVEPVATWENGQLRASFDFAGTGGEAGTFDWEVPGGSAFPFNTSFQQITGGPGFQATSSINVLDGVLQVRNLRVPADAVLRASGPNPLRIFATGTVEILGTIDVSGAAGPDTNQLQSPNVAKTGAPSNCGGGRGGGASQITNTSTPKGGTGFGAFNAPAGGGEGGESAYLMTNNALGRTASGGGGGSFANVDASGNDVEGVQGGTGAANAFSAVTDTQPAIGGMPGPSPFVDNDDTNDFFGLRTEGDALIVGELEQPWAGAGGGGGGDSTNSNSFPQQGTFVLSKELAGAGGGGGGGQLQILSLGDITFSGPNARVVSDGGRGGRGESSNFLNGIGGSGGAGSGGHIILQTAGNLDIDDLVKPDPVPIPQLGGEEVVLDAFSAAGGPGGPGQDFIYTNANGPLIGAGGAGSAGVIQIHVRSTDNIIPGVGKLNNFSVPDPWICAPTYGAVSRARTIYLPLGGARLNPLSDIEQVFFNFQGVDLTANIEDPDDEDETIPNPDFGRVLTAGNQVTQLNSILDGTVLDVDPINSAVSVDASALLTDVSAPFSNDIYLRNTELLRQFGMRLSSGANVVTFSVAEGSFDSDTDELTLVLIDPTGTLVNFTDPGVDFDLVPRFYRVFTNGVPDFLPDSASVKFRFQGVGSDANGNPDPTNILVPQQSSEGGAEFTSNIQEFNDSPAAGILDYVRMEIEFDLDAEQTGLQVTNPRPVLDFARLVLKF